MVAKFKFYTLPCTPSDIRSPHNVRSDIRRLLREDGVLTTTPKPVFKQPDRFTLLERRVAALEREVHQFISGENRCGKAASKMAEITLFTKAGGDSHQADFVSR